MAKVIYDHVTKRFDDVIAVNDFNIVIEDKEFLVLVGPSGCGKTTASRCLAGLEDISDGRILIGDRVVNDVAPKIAISLWYFNLTPCTLTCRYTTIWHSD